MNDIRELFPEGRQEIRIEVLEARVKLLESLCDTILSVLQVGSEALESRITGIRHDFKERRPHA